MTVAEQDLRPAWSQGAAIAAESDRPPTQNVRLRRLVVDQRELQLVTDVHPSLTVVVVPSGRVDHTRRLVGAAFGRGEAGVHVELTDGQGRNLLLFRPHGGRSRVLDLDTQLEALPPVPARSWADDRWTPTTPEPDLVSAEVVLSLSAVDQPTLWDAADHLTAVLDRCAPANDAAATDGDDLEGGQASDRRVRRRSRRAGLGRRSHRDHDADRDATTDAARAAWRAVAGEVPLDAALRLRRAIEACAVARSRTVALAAVSPASPADLPAAPDVAAEPAPVAVVAEVLAAVLGEPADSPQTLVLPPCSAAGAGVQLLLDVLPDLVGGRQVLVVTCDADVADWGRLEALAGRATFAQARCRRGPSA